MTQRSEVDNFKESIKKAPGLLKWIIFGIIVVIASLIFKPFSIIPADSLGLRFTFGKVSEDTIKPGLAWKIPVIQSIDSITLRPMQLDTLIEVDTGGAITKDNQTIGTSLSVFYRYVPEKLVDMYKSYGEERLASILRTSITESFKSVIGKYDIFELSMKQDMIRKESMSEMKRKMELYPVVVTELKITNYDWSEQFDKQISETMNRAQQVRQKEQEVQIANQEAQKKVKIAEADKQARVTTAEGKKLESALLADAKDLEGKGILRYNESIKQSMDLEIKIRELEIEKLRVEKWDGKYVPINNYGPIPLQTGDLQPELNPKRGNK